jgi:hypoxanthine-guanine phosphoribosyltransferase
MKVAFSRQRLATRVSQLGRTTSRDYACGIVDVAIMLENSALFAADLVREISNPPVRDSVRSKRRDVRMGDYDCPELFPAAPPSLRGRDVLVVDAEINTGVARDFSPKRLGQGRPRSLCLGVLLDEVEAGKVNLQAEYMGVAAASKEWMELGYGLGGRRGRYRNLPYVAASSPGTSRAGYQGPDRKVSRG